MSFQNERTSRGSQWRWWIAGLLAIAIAFALDDVVDRCLLVTSYSPACRTAELVSYYGDWPPILAAGLALAIALSLARKASAAQLVLLVLVSGLLTGFSATIVRSLAGRTRPSAAVPEGFYGPRCAGKWTIGKYQFSSFPSGHTAAWAGLAGAAWFSRRKIAIALLATAALVAWSRIALNCHHFSDVTAALVFGLAIGDWLCRRLDGIFSQDKNYDAATSA